jgi:hypothetical protein
MSETFILRLDIVNLHFQCLMSFVDFSDVFQADTRHVLIQNSNNSARNPTCSFLVTNGSVLRVTIRRVFPLEISGESKLGLAKLAAFIYLLCLLILILIVHISAI